MILRVKVNLKVSQENTLLFFFTIKLIKQSAATVMGQNVLQYASEKARFVRFL